MLALEVADQVGGGVHRSAVNQLHEGILREFRDS
jgi:hypothetical protein